MIGRTAAMRRAFEMADRVAGDGFDGAHPGESGTGKDLLAQEIHAVAAQRQGVCSSKLRGAAGNADESELFGFERGALPGRRNRRKGSSSSLRGNTVLDEIGDMNPVTQSKVLRALENRTIERLGGTQSIPVDVRIISATHRNLAEAIRDGKFREDLFYRCGW